MLQNVTILIPALSKNSDRNMKSFRVVSLSLFIIGPLCANERISKTILSHLLTLIKVSTKLKLNFGNCYKYLKTLNKQLMKPLEKIV